MKYLLIFLFSIKCLALASTTHFNKKVGVLFWSATIEGQVAMKHGLENKFKELLKKDPTKKFELISYIAGDDEVGIENQIKQFNDLIDQKVDIIIVQPTNNAALVPALKRANQGGIPVISYDQYIISGNITSFISSDNYQAGYLNGEYIASYFNNHEHLLKIVLVEYPIVSSPVERVNGFLDALSEHKVKYKIVKTYNAIEPVAGARVAKQILNDFPLKGSLDVVFSVNDGGGYPVAKLLSEMNRSEIVIASIDGDPRSIEMVKKSEIVRINTAQFCSAIGEKTMEIAFDILDGKKVARKILVPTFPVTKETSNLYHGWKGAIPSSFEKPWKKKSFWNNNFKYIE